MHWTYEILDDGELQQGDILRPTDPLRAIFADVQPHFSHDKYLGFLIATQSCDLVRRHATPKAGYINLVAIRPLSQVITKIFEHVAPSVAPRTFRKSDRGEARRLLQRLLNQNEQSIGLFFLYPDPDVGIAEPAAAFLRIAVALRAEHYDVLREARAGTLAADFRAKLGWLIGNLYVRPATPDWADAPQGRQRFADLIDQNLDDVHWIDDEIADEARARRLELVDLSPEQREALRPPTRLDRALEEVGAELQRVNPEFPTDLSRKLRNRLRANGKFSKLFK